MDSKRFFYYGLACFVVSLAMLAGAHVLTARMRDVADRAQANVEKAGLLIEQAKETCAPVRVNPRARGMT